MVKWETSERRRSWRVEITAEVRCKASDGRLFSGRVGNVSEGGMFLEVAEFGKELPEGNLSIRFELPQQVLVELSAQVVREERAPDGTVTGLGLEFVHPPSLIAAVVAAYVGSGS